MRISHRKTKQHLRPGTFGTFPASLCAGRPWQDQLVLAWIWFFKNQETCKCFPSIPTLAGRCSVSENTVRSAIKSLVKSGLLLRSEQKRDNGSQTSNEYECLISIDPPSPDEGVGSGGEPPGSGDEPLEPEGLDQTNEPDTSGSSNSGQSKPALALGSTPLPPSDVTGSSALPAKASGLPVETFRHTEVAPPARKGQGVAVCHPPAPKETWLTAYDALWHQKTEGHMIFVRVSKIFKALQDEHGRDKVLAAFERYCRETEARFLSVHRFASTVGVYLSSTHGMFIKKPVDTDNIM